MQQALKARYGIDQFNDWFFVKGTRLISRLLYQYADAKVIDDWIVNGAGRGVSRVAAIVRRLQTGYLYHYAFAMMLGLFGLLCWLLLR